eukprot:scaffold19184_cov112-Isochrysis_galbana.AAC.4
MKPERRRRSAARTEVQGSPTTDPAASSAGPSPSFPAPHCTRAVRWESLAHCQMPSAEQTSASFSTNDTFGLICGFSGAGASGSKLLARALLLPPPMWAAPARRWRPLGRRCQIAYCVQQFLSVPRRGGCVVTPGLVEAALILPTDPTGTRHPGTTDEEDPEDPSIVMYNKRAHSTGGTSRASFQECANRRAQQLMPAHVPLVVKGAKPVQRRPQRRHRPRTRRYVRSTPIGTPRSITRYLTKKSGGAAAGAPAPSEEPFTAAAGPIVPILRRTSTTGIATGRKGSVSGAPHAGGEM